MNIHQRLQEVFCTVFNDDLLEITPQTTADEVAGWDSVAHINLMFAIEQEFGVQFHGNQLAEFQNLGELEAFLAEKSR